MLLESITNYQLILASASPRRQQLVKELGLQFRVESGLNADESFPESMDSKEVPLHIARNKSHAFPTPLGEGEILITADTIVSKAGEILQKPENEEDAFRILRRISNGSHHVFTGVHMRSNSAERGFVASTEVRFGRLSDEEINYYIQTFKPYDKAGAYGIQEWIGFVGVEEIRGSYFNVMGLPIHTLYRELELFIQ